jgi:hypothetical protein
VLLICLFVCCVYFVCFVYFLLEVVAAVGALFESRAKMSFEEWTSSCNNAQKVFSLKLKNSILAGGLGWLFLGTI